MEKFLNVGDKVKIYNTDDDELNYWLDEQNTNIFEVEDIDMENGYFWIKGCEYHIEMIRDDWEIVEESITEDVEEDLDEAFYEKICRAYIDTVNLEWVAEDKMNGTVVHGYFENDDYANKYKDKVNNDNFRDIYYGQYTDEYIEEKEPEYYSYQGWENFYYDYVEDEIKHDIEDIGVYSYIDDTWDFYISEEDLIKLELWDEEES